ncbi:hypothetical protein RFI_28700, partial [Reticulomyxa filosa]
KVETEYESGSYRYFDDETGWCQRLKPNFVFQYCYLEDQVPGYKSNWKKPPFGLIGDTFLQKKAQTTMPMTAASGDKEIQDKRKKNMEEFSSPRTHYKWNDSDAQSQSQSTHAIPRLSKTNPPALLSDVMSKEWIETPNNESALTTQSGNLKMQMHPDNDLQSPPSGIESEPLMHKQFVDSKRRATNINHNRKPHPMSTHENDSLEIERERSKELTPQYPSATRANPPMYQQRRPHTASSMSQLPSGQSSVEIIYLSIICYVIYMYIHILYCFALFYISLQILVASEKPSTDTQSSGRQRAFRPPIHHQSAQSLRPSGLSSQTQDHSHASHSNTPTTDSSFNSGNNRHYAHHPTPPTQTQVRVTQK